MAVNRLTLKIGGEAGFGIKSAGLIFAKACTRAGLHVFGYTEYPSLIRGGHNLYQLRIGEEEVFSPIGPTDLLLALNKESIRLHKETLTHGSGIIYDKEKVKLEPADVPSVSKLFGIPLSRIAKERVGGGDILVNNVVLGAATAVLSFDLSLLLEVIADAFSGKGQAIVTQNQKAAEFGYQYITKNFPEPFPHRLRVKERGDPRLVLTGNEAVGLGALAGGVQFYCAYPMTPATSILHFMATYGPRYAVLVKQPEDELSVINTAIGAAFAGARTMVATAGGGFALMNEGFGLAGITETPLVVYVGQRPGPATGLPTWSSQGDLRFVYHAAQGEFPRFIIAPGDVREAFYTTIHAFNLAEKYQTPVVLLFDKFLAESHKSEEIFDTENIAIQRGKLLTENTVAAGEYKRYQYTEDGISPRALPGMKNALFIANSDEHDEWGFSSEDSQTATKMMDKRFKKLETARHEVPDPILYGEAKAKVTLVGWGSTKGPILEALKLFKWKNVPVNFLHLVYLSPFPRERVAQVLDSAETSIVIENNKTSQLRGLVREFARRAIDYKILKYDGRPFYPEEIYERVMEVIS